MVNNSSNTRFIRHLGDEVFEFLVVDFEPGCLGWAVRESIPCDIVVAILGEFEHSQAALEIVSTKVDWVYVYGEKSEEFHDFVDLASVKIGRQAKVGDGDPMTSWHDQLQELPQRLTHVISANLTFIVLLMGQNDRLRSRLLEGMHNCLTAVN